jgi:hypothetical protein
VQPHLPPKAATPHLRVCKPTGLGTPAASALKPSKLRKRRSHTCMNDWLRPSLSPSRHHISAISNRYPIARTVLARMPKDTRSGFEAIVVPASDEWTWVARKGDVFLQADFSRERLSFLTAGVDRLARGMRVSAGIPAFRPNLPVWGVRGRTSVRIWCGRMHLVYQP